MDRNNQASRLFVVLYYGALWGLAEATAGHVLHLLRIPGLAGFIMFPLGFFLMSRAFNRSGRFLAVFLTSWIAAGIKLADLFLPGADFLAVWNPVQAILLEGLAAAGCPRGKISSTSIDIRTGLKVCPDEFYTVPPLPEFAPMAG